MSSSPPYAVFAVGRLVVGVVCLGCAIFLGYVVIPDYAPAVRAQRGSGQKGVFVAERLDCSRRCVWYGRFHADSGQTVRRNVWLEGAGRDDLAAGRPTRALDTGARHYVYTPEGDPYWLGLIGGTLLGLAGLLCGCHLLRAGANTLRRRP
ncbi:hypothetical protein [Thermomonospora cellulosilytica]|uniref:DUF3592 domain-containing protein n=1 Tax=Thermomonospora cellulosilytica TaxID=1411118 RepID=A0A7W3N0B3_9ACTN|nr:hypothetical protein [Thermomonospora cellulosilytica]MBA9005196.1 hypothetical protein [Thermomonospora cellulosilytica]